MDISQYSSLKPSGCFKMPMSIFSLHEHALYFIHNGFLHGKAVGWKLLCEIGRTAGMMYAPRLPVPTRRVPLIISSEEYISCSSSLVNRHDSAGGLDV
jgi:hypothetical protein